MASYELTSAADSDLEDIIRYTLGKWGGDQARKYVRYLDRHFEDIGSGEALVKPVIEGRDDLLASRCQKHVIFHQAREGDCPLILAVFHERMNLMMRLRDRLGEAGL